MTYGELQEKWPEGWLGRRYSYDSRGGKKNGDYVYVIPRKAQNTHEITLAASIRKLAHGEIKNGAFTGYEHPIQVIWYWGDPERLNVAPLEGNW